MTWIETVSPNDSEEVREAMMSQRHLYPAVYGAPKGDDSRLPPAVLKDSIVMSHSLMPQALRHAFSAFGAMMAPELPLTRREHEMVAATVSATNSCFY
ncbi:MAG: hypothetical protein QM758_26755 [Armatimonas sp.]